MEKTNTEGSPVKKSSLSQWFWNISIARKLYFVVGVMALLIAVELFSLVFSLNALSSLRAYVGAEGLWSKGQKDAIYVLRKYASSGNEADYQEFLHLLQVPLGDRITRIEMAKENPNYEIMRNGFLQGGIHPDDIDGMIKLFRRFHSVSYIKKAIAVWTEGDSLMISFQKAAENLHSQIAVYGVFPSIALEKKLNEIDGFNKKFTIVENKFSSTLGEGSRWLEQLILEILLSIALTVEISGLLITIAISRKMSKSIDEILRASEQLGKGNYKAKAIVYSKDEIGQLASSFNTMTDELELQVKQLRESEDKFKGLLASAPDAMVIAGADGKILMINIQTEKMFGFTKDEIIGQPVELLIPQRFKKNHEEHRSKFFADSKVRGMGIGLELFGKRKNGEEFPVEISLSPLKTNDNIIVSASIRDITERKKSEIKLKQFTIELETKNKELEQFAYIASHDLQEPLRTVSNYVRLFQKKYIGKLDENSDEYLDFIMGATTRMQSLIKDLLEYSRIGRDESIVDIDCDKMLNNILRDMNTSIKESEVEINLVHLPTIKGFPILKSLFQNLISNAVKFKKAGKQLTVNITAQSKDNEWLFSIKDNGIGIEKTHQEKIFKIFQRLHSLQDYPGTGIGLAQCRKIVELHQGEIWVESELEKGSTFYFTIPKK